MSIKLKLLNFYKRNKEILEEIVRICENREVAYMYENKVFGKRPSVIQVEGDVIEYIRKGAISFHISEERWRDPLQLSTSLKKRELDELRIGWDLIIDIDSKDLFLSKIVALEIIKVLKKYSVSSYSIKYSGNKGFHIAIPWEAFPSTVMENETRKMFPDLPRTISMFILSKIRNSVLRELLKNYSEEEILKRYNIDQLEVQKLISIDTILISSRHLFRMPFSLNEKTNLLSIPLKENEIKYFTPDDASLENYEYDGSVKFLDVQNIKPSEAETLVYSALAWEESEKIEKTRIEQLAAEFKEKEIEREIREEIEQEKKILARKRIKKFSEEYFPPCIGNILKGLEDGRKRAVFILINFLAHVGWKWDEIKDLLYEWNEKNAEPLRERYIEYQLEWHRKKYKEKKDYLPPNCDNKQYYQDIGVCSKDDICLTIKNPLQYPFRKYLQEQKERKNSKNIKDTNK